MRLAISSTALGCFNVFVQSTIVSRFPCWFSSASLLITCTKFRERPHLERKLWGLAIRLPYKLQPSLHERLANQLCMNDWLTLPLLCQQLYSDYAMCVASATLLLTLLLPCLFHHAAMQTHAGNSQTFYTMGPGCASRQVVYSMRSNTFVVTGSMGQQMVGGLSRSSVSACRIDVRRHNVIIFLNVELLYKLACLLCCGNQKITAGRQQSTLGFILKVCMGGWIAFLLGQQVARTDLFSKYILSLLSLVAWCVATQARLSL